MADRTPVSKEGIFQWNRGAWFGSQLGGTAWIFVGAIALARQSFLVAMGWLACGVIANAVGFGLWSLRDRIRPYAAIQLLLLTIGLCALFAFGFVDLFVPEGFARLDPFNPRADSHRSPYAALLGIPVMMAWFAFLEHGARRQARKHSTQA